MGKILVIGASGFIGWHLVRFLGVSGKATIATYHSHPIIPEGPTIVAKRLDACDRDQVRGVVERHRPSTIINLAGATLPDWCESHRESAFKLNVQLPENLVAVSRECTPRIIHLSTCHVFSGDLPFDSTGYREGDLPAPTNYYGETKLLGESVIREYPLAVVCRLAHVLGTKLPHQEPNLFTKYHDNFRDGKPVAVLGKREFIKPIYVKDLINVLMRLIQSGTESGLFHCAGPEEITKEGLARKICETWGFDTRLIVPAGVDDCRARRPMNSCLDNARIKSVLGIKCQDIITALKDIKQGMDDDSFNGY